MTNRRRNRGASRPPPTASGSATAICLHLGGLDLYQDALTHTNS